jgi:hypothetical protein
MPKKNVPPKSKKTTSSEAILMEGRRAAQVMTA